MATDTTTYAAEVARLDAHVEALEEKWPQGDRDWGIFAKSARALLDRAHLTGSYEDYANAEKLIERAFGAAPEGSGPFLLRAQLNHALHRLARIEADLVKVESAVAVSNATRAAIAGLRGDVHFHRGELAAARDDYQAADELAQTPANAFRLAQLALMTAEDEEAQSRLTVAEQRIGKGPAPRLRAWFKLQRGIFALERGRYDEALGHYRAADGLMDGWWLVEEHIAEILTLTGKVAEARTMYEDIVERTGHPEFMDALAEIALESEKREKALEWIDRSRATYEARIAMLPTAAGGHAIDHYLTFADVDPEGSTKGYLDRALELAQANVQTRPSAEALQSLAEAHLALGNTDEALENVERALATGWQSADLFAAAAEIFEAKGDSKRAEEAAAQSRALNPQAE